MVLYKCRCGSDDIHFKTKAVSYNKLWKLLIDKNMKKKELGEAAGISNTLIAKLGKNENVTVEVLVKICAALDCKIEDIMELIPDEKQAI